MSNGYGRSGCVHRTKRSSSRLSIRSRQWLHTKYLGDHQLEQQQTFNPRFPFLKTLQSSIFHPCAEPTVRNLEYRTRIVTFHTHSHKRAASGHTPSHTTRLIPRNHQNNSALRPSIPATHILSDVQVLRTQPLLRAHQNGLCALLLKRGTDPAGLWTWRHLGYASLGRQLLGMLRASKQ